MVSDCVLAGLQTEAFLEMLGLPYNLEHGANVQHGSSSASAGASAAGCSLHVCHRRHALLSGWRGGTDDRWQYAVWLEAPARLLGIHTASPHWAATGSIRLDVNHPHIADPQMLPPAWNFSTELLTCRAWIQQREPLTHAPELMQAAVQQEQQPSMMRRLTLMGLMKTQEMATGSLQLMMWTSTSQRQQAWTPRQMTACLSLSRCTIMTRQVHQQMPAMQTAQVWWLKRLPML